MSALPGFFRAVTGFPLDVTIGEVGASSMVGSLLSVFFQTLSQTIVTAAPVSTNILTGMSKRNPCTVIVALRLTMLRVGYTGEGLFRLLYPGVWQGTFV